MKKLHDTRVLLSSLKMKKYLLKNRIILAPMSTQMANSDGSISDQMIDYYADKAAGGAAMVITETFHVDNKASRFTFVQPSIYHDRFIPGLSNLADEIRKGGSLSIAQIGHAGRQTIFEVNSCQPVAPTKIAHGLTENCHELTKAEIDDIVHSFVEAAFRAEIAGFDGIELHGGNGYLINEFLSPFTNKRTDEYGTNRALFFTQIINEVKKRINRDLIIGVRVGFSDFVNGGLQPHDAIEFCLLLPQDKIDYIHTSAGTVESDDYRIQPFYHEHALLRNIAKDLKGRTQVPVLLTGSINSPRLAEELLINKEADLIGMGRQLLADPTLPKKAAGGQGNEIRPCIRCNQGCLNRVRLGKTIKCSVNPRLGYERSEVAFSNKVYSRKKRTVLVAGAGPAGITAALRANELGFRVRLFEKDEMIGGLLNTAKHEHFKQDIRDYLAYLTSVIFDSGFEIATSTKADTSLLGDENPDILINATGSIPIMPEIPPNMSYTVVETRSILMSLDAYYKKQRVVIIGGGAVGCELGYALSLNGEDVTIVEQASDILLDIDPVSSLALKRLLGSSGVTICRNTRFMRFDRKEIITNRNDSPIPADLVIIAMGSRPNSEFNIILKQGKWKLGHNYLCIGDAHKIGKIYEGVNDTYWSVSNFLAGH